MAHLIEQGAFCVFLGINEPEGFGRFAIDITFVAEKNKQNAKDLEKEVELSLGDTSSFKEIRPSAFSLSLSHEASIIAQGRSIIDWNSRSVYCSICGSATGLHSILFDLTLI